MAARASRTTSADPLPWNFQDTVFRCAWEYEVVDFDAEVGFYLGALGLSPVALNEEYALFASADGEVEVACRKSGARGAELAGHRLTLMTRDIESLARGLAARLPAQSIERSAGSPVQTVISVETPAGLKVDIWEDPGLRDH